MLELINYFEELYLDQCTIMATIIVHRDPANWKQSLP